MISYPLAKSFGYSIFFQVPPPDVLPQGSLSLDMAAETQFTSISSDDPLDKVCSWMLTVFHWISQVPKLYKLGAYL